MWKLISFFFFLKKSRSGSSYMPGNRLLPVILFYEDHFCLQFVLIIWRMFDISGASLHSCCSNFDLSLWYFLFVLSVLLFEDIISDSFPFSGKILHSHAWYGILSVHLHWFLLESTRNIQYFLFLVYWCEFTNLIATSLIQRFWCFWLLILIVSIS